ncbi:unnamed protein product [Rhizopus microsporus]
MKSLTKQLEGFTISKSQLNNHLQDVEEPDSTSKITSRHHIELDRRRHELEDMDGEQVAAFYVEKYGPSPSALSTFGISHKDNAPFQFLFDAKDILSKACNTV